MQNKKKLDFNKNEDNMKLLIGNLKHHIASISHHKNKGKLTARERINFLIDPNSNFLEIGSLRLWICIVNMVDVILLEL